MAAASSFGHTAEGFHVDGQGQVHIGDIYYDTNPNPPSEASQGSQAFLGNIHGLTINPTAAAQIIPYTYKGHYSQSSVGPIKNYVQRPALYEQVRKQLHNAQTQPKETTILVVWGSGGAGKSQLILDYLHKHRGEYNATFWTEAARRESVDDRDFLQIYRLLYNRRALLDGENIRVEDAVSDVKSWFPQHLGRWLLIFDSADLTENKDDPSYYDLRCYLPNSPLVQIVITTRAEFVREISILDAVEVGEMEEIEAVELFFQSSKINDKIPQTEVEVRLIDRSGIGMSCLGCWPGRLVCIGDPTAVKDDYDVFTRVMISAD